MTVHTVVSAMVLDLPEDLFELLPLIKLRLG
jgi:hypothetical protein